MKLFLALLAALLLLTVVDGAVPTKDGSPRFQSSSLMTHLKKTQTERNKSGPFGCCPRGGELLPCF